MKLTQHCKLSILQFKKKNYLETNKYTILKSGTDGLLELKKKKDLCQIKKEKAFQGERIDAMVMIATCYHVHTIDATMVMRERGAQETGKTEDGQGGSQEE